MDGSGDGPDIGQPLIDWNGELSSRWNKEMILLLCREFLQRVKSGAELPLLFDPELMSETQLMQSCTIKLRRTHARVHSIGLVEAGKKKNRRCRGLTSQYAASKRKPTQLC